MTGLGAALSSSIRLLAGGLVNADGDLGPVDQDPVQVRDDACRILGASCTSTTAPPSPSPSPSPSGGGFALGQLITVLLVAALVAAIVLAVVWYVRSAAPRVPVDAGADEPEPVAERIVDHDRPPDAWRAAAAQHLAAGRFRDALRCRYRALVGDLARRGLLDEIPGRTTGEERDQLAELAPASSPAFDRASSMFDDAWYGNAPVGREDHDRFVAEEHAVLAIGAAPRRGHRHGTGREAGR